MNKIQHKYCEDWIFIVYGARTKLDDIEGTEFLVYWDNSWTWVSAEEYLPYEE